MATTKRKVGVAIVVATALTIATLYTNFFHPTGYAGIYENKVSTWLASKASIDSEINYLVTNKYFDVAMYGVDGSFFTSATNIANMKYFALNFRRKGGKEIIYVFSSNSQANLDKYQKAATDSTKFNAAISEIEQYHADRATVTPVFYDCLRQWRKYADANKMNLYCYQGWPNQPDADTITKYCDAIFDHAYLKYDGYADPGKAIYDYQKSRNIMFANSELKLKKKIGKVVIYSWENPDQTKEQFGFNYFKAGHTQFELHQKFISYLNTKGDTLIRNHYIDKGSMGFVGDMIHKAKP